MNLKNLKTLFVIFAGDMVYKALNPDSKMNTPNMMYVALEMKFDEWVEIGNKDLFILDDWIDVDDVRTPMPKNTDFLIKLESGKIFRYYEDWSNEFEIVTHWKYF